MTLPVAAFAAAVAVAVVLVATVVVVASTPVPAAAAPEDRVQRFLDLSTAHQTQDEMDR